MVDNSWKVRIIDALEKLSSAEYQSRSWTGRGPEVSSCVETICMLFDDLSFDDFIISISDRLPPGGDDLASKLIKSIEELSDQYISHTPPEEILKNPDWINIQKLATQVKILISSI